MVTPPLHKKTYTMADFELVMPKMGESIAEATIIRWVKNVGDTVKADESVLEIATDKVDSEVPTPQGGVISKILFKEGDVVAVGATIAIISAEAGAGANPPVPAAPAPVAQPVKTEPAVETAAAQVVQNMQQVQQTVSNNGPRFYSPLVLNIAREEHISMQELENIAGTGNEGRVTKRDILAYVENRKSGQVTTAPAAVVSTPVAEVKAPAAPVVSENSVPAAPAVKPAGKIALMPGDEIIEMDRMRKLIADHMVMSKHTSPHVTSFVEADVTNMVMWREKVKKNFEKREGEKITFTPLFIECVVKAIKDYPMINISIDGQNIIKRKSINVGMAAALPSGNLIVPVIKNADTMNLVGLTKSVNDLAARARANKLSPDEIAGGTFTLTNVGGFGNVMGTPIINQPQVAIMATGSIKKKPAVMETEMGDVIAIRHMMFLSLSYDHRVVDGSLGGSFLRRVGDYMEQWDMHREY